MDWQHYDAKTRSYNFLIARHRSGEIHAILGFIPTSQFDPALEPEKQVWLAIWKVRDDVKAPGLGLNLMLTFLRTQQPKLVASVGISKLVIPIYRALRFTMGTLPQYYLRNPRMKKFQLLSGAVPASVRGGRSGRLALKRVGLSELDVLAPAFGSRSQAAPKKTLTYYRRRYAEHPIYKYDFLAWQGAKTPGGFVVVRRSTHEGAAALRIVDFHGAPADFGELGAAFADLLVETNSEFVDFLTLGAAADHLEAAGFKRRSVGDKVVVPNYFEPFRAENIDIDFAYKIAGAGGAFNIVKGDADQDRPNVL